MKFYLRIFAICILTVNKYKKAGSIIYEISQLNKSAIIDGMRHLSEK